MNLNRRVPNGLPGGVRGRKFYYFLLLDYIKILVSEQGNAVCEKTVELSQFVDYEERQKGLS